MLLPCAYDKWHTLCSNTSEVEDMSAVATKTERLSCRITPEHKRLLEHVAARHGMNVSDYFITLAVEYANRELTDELVIRVPRAEWDNLLTSLESGSGPNEKLKAAAREFAAGAFDGDVYHAPD